MQISYFEFEDWQRNGTPLIVMVKGHTCLWKIIGVTYQDMSPFHPKHDEWEWADGTLIQVERLDNGDQSYYPEEMVIPADPRDIIKIKQIAPTEKRGILFDALQRFRRRDSSGDS